jgi:hypothetical protein
MNEEHNKMQNAASWPMSNEELQQWFARPNIPIEVLTQMWLSMDQNPSTKSEIVQLRSNNEIHELEKRLRNRIQFGTAGILSSLPLSLTKGLRGRMEAGFSRMNNLTVIQASQVPPG